MMCLVALPAASSVTRSTGAPSLSVPPRSWKSPGAPLGKEHAPLPLDPVDERVDGARLQRIPADEQRVKAERLPEVLVFDKS
jgi:hypothetical protein